MISSSFRHLASRSKSSLPQRALDALRSGNVDKTKKPVLAPNKPAPVAADTMVGNTKISTLPKPNAPDAVYPKPNPNAGIFKTPTNPAAAPIEATLSNIIKPSEPSLILPPAPSLNVNAFQDFAPRISVIGVGGAGGNAVNNMIARNLNGCDFLAINTDAQHLSTTLTDQRLQIGREVTQGLGCGANPDAGRMAAEESADEIMEKIGDAHMVFITAGMGGGTGTGAAAVVADLCYKAGILTVGVVTKPFRFEGTHRMRLADEGIEKLSGCVDTMIVIPNQNLFQMVDPTTSLMDAFSMADDVLLAGVKSITDLMTNPGLINLDFADVQSVMSGMGNAMLGTGQSDSEGGDRAILASEMALSNPLLGTQGIKSAKGMLVNITGGKDMTLFEVDAAAQKLIDEVEDENANIIFGSAYDHNLEGSIRVSVVATGIETGKA